MKSQIDCREILKQRGISQDTKLPQKDKMSKILLCLVECN